MATDDPVRTCTDIAQEYRLALEMGFTDNELYSFTSTGIEASFTTTERKSVLRGRLDTARERGTASVGKDRLGYGGGEAR